MTVQVPAWTNCTRPSSVTVHAAESAPALNTTGLPDPPPIAVAAATYVSPTRASAGTDDLKSTTCTPGTTAIDCCSCPAAADSASPAWFALTTHVPIPLKATAPSVPTVQPTDEASAENTTG